MNLFIFAIKYASLIYVQSIFSKIVFKKLTEQNFFFCLIYYFQIFVKKRLQPKVAKLFEILRKIYMQTVKKKKKIMVQLRNLYTTCHLQQHRENKSCNTLHW